MEDEVWIVFWFLCMMWVAPGKIHRQLLKVYGVCVIPWKQAATVHGFHQWQDRRWPGHQALPLLMMRGVQTRSAADVARELDMHWVARRIVQDRLDYREVCHRIPQMMTKLIVCDSTCYTDQRGQFWRWSTKPKNRKRMCDRETVISLQQRKWKHWH